MARRIVCIHRDYSDYSNPFESIIHLGWMEDETRKTGKSTRNAFHDWIAAGGSAYVRDINGNDIRILHTLSASGCKCVETLEDHAEKNTLLKLIECP